jgi:hypothetical protein
MSEFSDPYHLRAMSRKAAVALLQSACLSGFVFPSLDGWVTLVAEGEPFRPNEDLIVANSGTLLHWVFGEDHGWEFAVYRGKRKLCQYSCSWEEEVVVEGKVSHAQLETDLGMPLPLLAGEAGTRVLYPRSIEEARSERPAAYAFAEAVGLTNYRWLSYDYLARDHAKGHPLPPGVPVV